MTAGLPGAKVVDLLRCLHRLPESWGGTSGHVSHKYHRHKKRQEESTDIQIQGFRKEDENWDVQNTSLGTSEARGKILISVYERGVRSRDSA